MRKDIANCKDLIVFYTDSQRVEVSKDDYNLVSNRVGFEVQVLDEVKLQAIRKLKRPMISFCYDKKMNKAVPNDILSSHIPNNADYFFSVNAEGSVAIFNLGKISITEVQK